MEPRRVISLTAAYLSGAKDQDLDQRVFGSDPSLALGIIAAAFGLPIVLSEWSPQWFWVAFMIMYLLVEFIAVLAAHSLRQHVKLVHQVEVVAGGIMFSLVPLSARWFDAEPERQVWVVVAVMIAFIAAESAVKPHLRNYEWRLGAVIAIASTAVGFIGPFGGWVLATAFVFVAGGSVHSGTRTMDTHLRLAEESKRANEAREIAITERRAAEHRATHDPLTEILNRRGITASITAHAGQKATVLIIDADRFKSVNDTWGHSVGDAALSAIAQTLQARFGARWEIGRLGGDEFAAVTSGHHYLPPGITERISFDPGLTTHAVSVDLGLSIGMTHAAGTWTADQVLSEASYALRIAKRTPGVSVRILEGSLRERFSRSNEVSAMIDASFNAGEFSAVIQPIVNTTQGTVGGEVLARWTGNDGQVLHPAEFLPLLTEAGMLPELGWKMLEHAVRFAARFNHLLHAPYISVNLAASQLAMPELVPLVHRLLETHTVLPERILIEITESESLDRVDGWEVGAEALRAIGVGLAIDDFGAGYSSVERMTSLPISHLKLDRSFTTRVSSAYGEIVRGVVNFARATNLGLIAEGIETFDQKVAMEAIGVTTMQGYWFAKPTSLDNFERAILAERARTAAFDHVRQG